MCWEWQLREEPSHSGGEFDLVNGVRNRLSRTEGDEAWSGSAEGSEERTLRCGVEEWVSVSGVSE